MHISSVTGSSSSLLEMLQKVQSNNSTQGSGKSLKTSTATATPEDSVSISNSDMSKMMDFIDQLQELSVSDPAKFKEVMTDMAAKLREAAGKSNDSQEKQFLTSMADSFDASAESGKLERPEPPQHGAGAGERTRHGHRPPPPPSLSQMRSETQDLMTSLFDEVSKAVSASKTSSGSTTSQV